MPTPIIGDAIAALVKNTVGKVTTGLIDHYLPASMSEQERAEFKLRAEELTVRELEGNKDLVVAVNETMRAEAKSDNWWTSGWRPFWGFVSGLAFLFVCVLVSILMYKAVLGGKPEAMAVIPQVIGSFAALFAIPGAILGVTAWHRGQKQRIDAGETKGLLKALTDMVKKD